VTRWAVPSQSSVAKYTHQPPPEPGPEAGPAPEAEPGSGSGSEPEAAPEPAPGVSPATGRPYSQAEVPCPSPAAPVL